MKGRGFEKPARGVPLVVALFSTSAVIILGPLLAISLLAVNNVEKKLGDHFREKNEILATAVAHEANALLDGYFSALTILKEDSSLSSMEKIRSAFPGFSAILFVDSSGIVRRASGDSGEEGYDVSRRDFFTKPMETKRRAVSFATMSRTSYDPIAYLSIPAFGGVVAGVLDLKSLSDYIVKLSSAGTEGLIAIADASGDLVAHSDRRRVERREKAGLPAAFRDSLGPDAASSIIMGSGEAKFLSSAARIGDGAWVAIVSQSLSAMRQPIRELLVPILSALALAGVLLLAIAIAFALLIGMDLRKLVKSMHAISGGSFGREPPPLAFRELNSLAGDFSDMASAIEDREARLSDNLRQKEALIKEVHHRVKNNLQLVESLLSLESARSGDWATTEAFDKAIARVDTLAAIHEMLYQSDDLSRIAFDDYLRSLSSALIDPALLRIETQVILLEIDRAIPCGMIANELLTNALKYAGPNEKISIGLHHEDGGILLEIADNGPGLPPGFDPASCASLGMQVIISLCQQINARWKVESGAGTHWSIHFPLSRA